MAPVPPKLLRFSTDDYPAQNRIEAYREIYGRTILRHDIEPIGDQPFHFEATLCSLPGLGMASSSFTPCRRAPISRHADSDDFILGIGLSGRCIISGRSREAAIGKGGVVLTNCADPPVVLIPMPSRSISLRVPGAVLRSRIADIDARVTRSIPGNVETLALLTGFVGAIQIDDVLAKPQLRELVVAHVHDLVSLFLGAEGEARQFAEENGARAARRAAILREIERRGGDPGLSAVTVAALLGITPRYVHLLLEETGKSFTHHVLERRLETAAALLRDPNLRHRKVADIATEAGFADLSYFNRAFRRHYGATPTDIRQRAYLHG
ncbi:MAG: AraC family transcriptional regulator [Xanthobacteraceae bacterium]